MDNNTTNTTEVVQEEEVKAPIKREVCGITFEGNEHITDDELISFDKLVSKMTFLELAHYIGKYTEDIAMSERYRELVKSSNETIDSFNQLADVFEKAQRDDAATALALRKNIEAIESENMEEDIDFDEIDAQITEYQERLKLGIMILEKWRVAKREANPEYSLTDDILETLAKHIGTIDATNNINKEFSKKHMQTVVDEISASEDKMLDPRSRLLSKLQNPKRNKELVKFVLNNDSKAISEYRSVELTDDMLRDFVAFNMSEYKFFELYHEVYCDTEDDECINVYKNHNELTKKFGSIESAYTFLSKVFFYHVSKIVKTEVRKTNYLSLIFKCYILQTIEMAYKTSAIIKDTTECREERRNAPKDSELYKVSHLRQRLFKQYDEIFGIYIDAIG